MDGILPRRVSIRVDRIWDDAVMQTADVRPSGSHAALLNYVIDPWPEDGGLPADIAAALAEGLTRCGLVAGRWFDEDLPCNDVQFLPAPPRGLLKRWVERAFSGRPADLILTRSPLIVGFLFDQGWWVRSQALLVLETVSEAGRDDVLQALRTLRDWSAFEFTPAVRALIAPGVDGEVVLVAAGSETELAELLNALGRCFRAAGFLVSSGNS